MEVTENSSYNGMSRKNFPDAVSKLISLRRMGKLDSCIGLSRLFVS